MNRANLRRRELGVQLAAVSWGRLSAPLAAWVNKMVNKIVNKKIDNS